MPLVADFISMVESVLSTLKIVQLVDHMCTPKDIDLKGNYISEWIEDERLHRETIRITRQRGERVYGSVESDTMPGEDCLFEGHYKERRFLILHWRSNANNKLTDYGCYFFEKYPDGLRFAGYSCGFFAHRGKDGKGELAAYWHVLRPTTLPKLIEPMVVILLNPGNNNSKWVDVRTETTSHEVPREAARSSTEFLG